MLLNQDSLAEWSKALASSASPQGRGFEPDSCQPSLFETTARVKVQVKHGHYILAGQSATVCLAAAACLIFVCTKVNGQHSWQLVVMGQNCNQQNDGTMRGAGDALIAILMWNNIAAWW